MVARGGRAQGRAKPRTSGSTPALRLLADNRIPHEVLRYRHQPGARDYGEEALRELTAIAGCDAAAVFKTLVWIVDGRTYFAVAPVVSRVCAKRLAAALGARSAALADQRTAERISGSVLGAISPLAPRTPTPMVIDRSATDHPLVYISAGRRGVEAALAPSELIAATDATVAPIVAGARDN